MKQGGVRLTLTISFLFALTFPIVLYLVYRHGPYSPPVIDLQNKDWLGFIGGYVGGCIGGLATLLAIYFTISNNNKETTRILAENHKEQVNAQKEQFLIFKIERILQSKRELSAVFTSNLLLLQEILNLKLDDCFSGSETIYRLDAKLEASGISTQFLHTATENYSEKINKYREKWMDIALTLYSSTRGIILNLELLSITKTRMHEIPSVEGIVSEHIDGYLHSIQEHHTKLNKLALEWATLDNYAVSVISDLDAQVASLEAEYNAEK